LRCSSNRRAIQQAEPALASLLQHNGYPEE